MDPSFTWWRCQFMAIQNPTQEPVATELAKLPGCSIHTLRERWRERFRGDPPAAFGPDLLRRSIAKKLQEDAYGTLSSAAQRELNRIVAILAKTPTARIELPRRIKPGAVLLRDWKGKTCRVTVRDKGFDYDGRTYSNLSEIAREITGTHWNGPRFFGLRPTERLRSADCVSEKVQKRTQSSKPIARSGEVGHGL
jgi:hypothetical protein